MGSPTDGIPPVPSVSTLVDIAESGRHLIVPDQALAAAIDTRSRSAVTVDTPESAVGGEQEAPIDRIDAIVDEFDAPLSAVIAARERCRTAWRYRGDPTSLATTQLELRMADRLRNSENIEATMANASPLEDIIVSHPSGAFDRLQADLLTDDVEVVTATDDPTAHVHHGDSIGSLLAESIDLISSHQPVETAIMATGSTNRYLRARLSAAGIEYTPTSRTTRASWRPFVELLMAAVDASTTRVSDVRGCLHALGVDLTAIDDEQPVSQLEDEGAIWLQTIIDHSDTLPIATLKGQFAFRSDSPFPTDIDPITALDIGNRTPTVSIVRDINTYLDVVAESTDRTGTGVELIDPRAQWTTARTTVVILADGEPWRQEAPPGLESRWDEVESYRLAQLLSAGDNRHVYTISSDEPTPFTDWFDTESRTSITTTKEQTDPFAYTPEGRERSGHDRFTKSRLNRLLSAPRDAMFGEILDRPERRAMTRGSAIHDYADLLVSAPTATRAIGEERIHQWIADKLAPLVPSHRSAVIDTRLWAAIAVVEAYLEELTPHPEALPGFSSPGWMNNSLADAFDITFDRTVTEQYFRDDELGISGVVDLIESPTHIVDFKTGSPRSVEQIVHHGRVPPPTRQVDVQLPMYLAALRTGQSQQSLAMTFVYCHGVIPAALAGLVDLAALSRTIEYHPERWSEVRTDPETIERLAAEVPPQHPRARLISELSAHTTASLLDGGDGGGDREVERELEAAGIEVGMTPAAAGLGARSLVGAIRELYQTTLFADDIDRFESFLDECRTKRSGFDHDGYPLGDPIERRLDFPELHMELSPVIGGDP